MKITGEDIGRPFALTGSAAPIFISEILADEVFLTINAGPQQVYNLRVTPDSNACIELDMREISTALTRYQIPVISQGENSEKTIAGEPIQIQAVSFKDETQTALARYVKCEVFPKSKWGEMINTRWSTWRSRSKYVTAREGREQLSVLYDFDAGGNGVKIIVKAYLVSGGAVEGLLYEFKATGTPEGVRRERCYVTVNCSLSAVARILGISQSSIKAYDVEGFQTGIGGDIRRGNFPYAQRFHVSGNSSKAECLLFRNTLGALDTVIATGAPAMKIDVEKRKIINRELESEHLVNAVPKITLSTYSADIATIELWQDLVRSEECYHATAGGMRRIIIDEYSLDSEVGSAQPTSITFHYAERTSGRYRPLEPLKQYQ